MALDSYTNLKAAMAGWLNRTDLTDNISDFISLAEADLKRRVRRKVVRATVTLSGASYSLPADCAELRFLRIASGTAAQDRPIKIIDPTEMGRLRSELSYTSAYGTVPKYGAVVGTDVLLLPSASSPVSAEIIYYQSLTPLSGSVATNAILTEAPDAYLYTALYHSAPFLEHDERIPTWKALSDQAIDALNTVRQREEEMAQDATRALRLPVTGIGTYDDVQRAVAAWLNRDDLAAAVPSFIALAEAEMNRVLRRSTSKTSVSITGEENDILPSNFKGMGSLVLVTADATLDKPMTEVTIAQLQDVKARAGGVTTRPTHYAIYNKKLYVAPVPDQTYSAVLWYEDGVTVLSNSNQTNDELTESPDLYLYGALLQAAPYLESDVRIPVWREAFQRAVDQHNKLRDDESYSGEIVEMRLPVVFG